MSSIIPYQIDYKVESAGKKLGSTKKKITFKFGLANCDAVNQGHQGVECRGTEHEVVFIWSLKTGKRQILVDGKEIHYSESWRNGWTDDRVFHHDFTLKSPGYSSGIRCQILTETTSSRGSSSDTDGGKVKANEIHPFDLKVNGMSYFDIGRIYELGTPQMKTLSLNKQYASPQKQQHHHHHHQDDPTYAKVGNPKHDIRNPYSSGLKAEASVRRRSLEKEPQQSAPLVPPPQQKEASLICFDDNPSPSNESDLTQSTFNTTGTSSQPQQQQRNGGSHQMNNIAANSWQQHHQQQQQQYGQANNGVANSWQQQQQQQQHGNGQQMNSNGATNAWQHQQHHGGFVQHAAPVLHQQAASWGAPPPSPQQPAHHNGGYAPQPPSPAAAGGLNQQHPPQYSSAVVPQQQTYGTNPQYAVPQQSPQHYVAATTNAYPQHSPGY